MANPGMDDELPSSQRSPSDSNEVTEDSNIVTLGSKDLAHPQNWTFRRKAMTMAMYSLITMTATFSSSIYSPCTDLVANTFNVSIPVSTLGTSLLLFGFAAGPLLFAPLSEVYGRKKAVLIPTFLAAVFAFGAGAAKDIQTVLICRWFQGVFGSAPITNVGGCVADMFAANVRGTATMVFTMVVVGGPTLGPIVGGAVCDSQLGWRWTQYLTGIFQVTVVALGVFLAEETYLPVLSTAKAHALRYETKNWALHARHEEHQMTVGDVSRTYLIRPFHLLATPICFSVGLYSAFVYGILFGTLGASPIVFQDLRGWNRLQGGLPFLGLLAGVFCGAGVNFANQKFYIAKWKANNFAPVPEARLPPMMVGSVVFVAGMFMFAWSSTPSVSWSVPVIGVVVVGIGIVTILQSTTNYLVDTFQEYPASAIAVNTFLRSSFAGTFPLFIPHVLQSVGTEWGISIFAFVGCVLVPIPYVFYYFGPAIRKRSAWSKPKLSN